MVQRKAIDGNAPDALERQADDVARLITSKGPPSGDGPLRRLEPRSQPHGGGAPLAVGTRDRHEKWFGVDLSSVRVHTGAEPARLASGLSARAFTTGTDIFLGSGVAQSDRGVLSHELTHVVQQESLGLPTVQRLSAADCASDCDVPDGTGTASGEFSITIYADKEGPFLLLPLTHKVGHSWLRLEDDAGRYWTYGFWPQEGYNASDTSADVEGCVHHPDTSHEPTASQKITLTAEEFALAHARAKEICTTKPKYNLFGLQCTEFVRRVMAAAGKAPALGFGLIWESPNALDTWLRTNSLILGIRYAPAGSSGFTGASLDLTYRHQVFSALGNSLRGYALGRGELGGGLTTATLGTGLELDPRRVWLPSLYLEGGGTAGAFPSGSGVGVSGAAGLRLRIDELAVVGVEYGVVRNIVREDPTLHRLLLGVGIRFF